MNGSKFSLVLRMCRENAGLTQKQVADALNMERSTYAYYESGVTHPSGMMIIRLANIFNVDYRLFMDAVGDFEFDSNPEDEQFTTLRDDSYERRERLYNLRKEEQDLVIRYRTFTDEQKERVKKLFEKLCEENAEIEKRRRSKR